MFAVATPELGARHSDTPLTMLRGKRGLSLGGVKTIGSEVVPEAEGGVEIQIDIGDDEHLQGQLNEGFATKAGEEETQSQGHAGHEVEIVVALVALPLGAVAVIVIEDQGATGAEVEGHGEIAGVDAHIEVKEVVDIEAQLVAVIVANAIQAKVEVEGLVAGEEVLAREPGRLIEDEAEAKGAVLFGVGFELSGGEEGEEEEKKDNGSFVEHGFSLALSAQVD